MASPQHVAEGVNKAVRLNSFIDPQQSAQHVVADIQAARRPRCRLAWPNK